MLRDALEYRRLAKLHALSSDRVWIDQVLGLRVLMKRLFDVPFYGDRLRKAGTKPGDLRTVKDLAMMPATTGAQFAEELRRRAGARDAARAPVSFDAAGRVLPQALGADARARRLHLFAALGAWGIGPRRGVSVSGEGFGQDDARDAFLFRVAREDEARGDRRDPRPARIIDPGEIVTRGSGAFARPDRDSPRRATTEIVILAGAPIPPGALDGCDAPAPPGAGPRAILGNALYGPIAWQCAAGAFHPIAGRAVIEAVTAESAARGLTGGSRASRAPREAGALHLTLIESSELPVFRVEMGLRGRIHPPDCACGAPTNRLEVEAPFLGPLIAGRGGDAGAGRDASRGGVLGGAAGATAVIDPLPILRAAAATISSARARTDAGFSAVHRAALIQEAPARIRVLLALEPAAGADAARSTAAGATRAVAALALPRDIEITVEAGEESQLPFPERGFVQGLGIEPILSISSSA